MQNNVCFLLSYIKYGDQDAVLHCFSAENGFSSFFIKGIYAPRNKKKPYLFPLSLLNITFKTNKNRTAISTVSKIESAKEISVTGDVRIHSILFFAADFLNQILQQESQNELAFAEIERFRTEIESINLEGCNALLFNFLRIVGIAPLCTDGKYLDVDQGTFTDDLIQSCCDLEISQIWRTFLNSENPYEIKLKRTQRKQFLDSLMRYYQWHFSGFFVPNSLAVLRQVYD